MKDLQEALVDAVSRKNAETANLNVSRLRNLLLVDGDDDIEARPDGSVIAMVNSVPVTFRVLAGEGRHATRVSIKAGEQSVEVDVDRVHGFAVVGTALVDMGVMPPMSTA